MAASAKKNAGQKRTDSRKHEKGYAKQEQMQGKERGEMGGKIGRSNRGGKER